MTVHEERPAWQRHPVFAFFASLRLAMLLLAVLIVGCVVGTLYESRFDAKVAQHYVYGARWFNAWLVLLAVNVAAAALSRRPWRRHHVAFLVTHLGILVLLAGALVGRLLGVEGMMTLREGGPPASMLVTDEEVVQVTEPGRPPQVVPTGVIHRKPTPERPRRLLTTPGGWRIDLVGASERLAVLPEPVPRTTGGQVAARITLASGMMGRQFDQWLFTDDPQHGRLDLGLAQVILEKGAAPPTAPSPNPAPAPVEIEEGIFAFARMHDQIGRPLRGGGSGVRVHLRNVDAAGHGTLRFEYQDRVIETPLPPPGTRLPLDGTPFEAELKNYWPDFRIQNGEPGTASDAPNNPAVFVIIRGTAVPAEVAPHGAEPAVTGENRLTIFVADNGALSGELVSRKNGRRTEALTLGQPLTTGWADWTVTVHEVLPHADLRLVARPAPDGVRAGVRVRLSREGVQHEEWVPSGAEAMMPVEPPVQIAFGLRRVPLPIAVRLLDFKVEYQEGTQNPAGFRSELEVRDMRGAVVRGACWMNHPLSHPAHWLYTWTGLTWKISQASWNPEDPAESTLQVLRDPGWALKWIGSLLIVTGIFLLFYVPQFRRPLHRRPGDAPAAAPAGVLPAANDLLNNP